MKDADRQYRLEKEVVASHQSITMCAVQVLVTFAHGDIGQIARIKAAVESRSFPEFLSFTKCQECQIIHAKMPGPVSVNWLARRAQKQKAIVRNEGPRGVHGPILCRGVAEEGSFGLDCPVVRLVRGKLLVCN